MDLRGELHEHICNLRYLKPSELDGSTPLVTSHLIDSLDLLEVVAFVEARSGISVSPAELSAENWDSIDQILAFVASKQTTNVR